MHSFSPAAVQFTESRRQDLLAAAATARLIESGGTETRRPGAFIAVLRAIASALSHSAALLLDSRETHRSKEHELAALGVTWGTDPAGDHALARELRASRARRQALRLPFSAGEPLEDLSAVRRAYAPRFQSALDAALSR